MGNRNMKVLFIEDDEVDRMAFARFVKKENLPYDYTLVSSVSEGKEALKSHTFEAVIADYYLNDGIVCDLFGEIPEDVPVIVVSARGDEEMAVKAMKEGASDYLVKDPEGNYLKILPVILNNALISINTQKAVRENKEAAQNYLNIAAVMILALDAGGKVSLVNKKGCEILECEEKDIIGKDWFENFIPESSRDEVKENFKRIMSGEIKSIEHVEGFSVLTKSGKQKSFSWNNALIRDQKGEIIGILSSGEDITTRKQMEEALRERNKELNGMYDLGQLSDKYTDLSELFRMFLKDVVPGSMQFSEKVYAKIDLYKEEFCNIKGTCENYLSAPIKVKGKKRGELFIGYTEDLPFIEDFEQKLVNGYAERLGKIIERVEAQEALQKAHDELEIKVQERTEDLIRTIEELHIENIERKKVERSLRESEEKYRSLFEKMLNGFAYCQIIIDEDNQPIDWVYLDVNEAFEKITCLKKEAVIGKKVTEAIPGIKEDCPELFDIYGKVALTEEEARFEIYLDTLKAWFSVIAFSPQKGYFVAVFDNITERKKAEIDLQKSEEQYRRLVENVPGILYSFSNKRGGTYYSSRVEQILGYSASKLYKNPFLWHDSIHPDDLEKFDKSIKECASGKSFDLEYRIRDAAGNWHWFHDRSIGIRIADDDVNIEGLSVDLTDQKKALEEKEHLESQLRQAQKMEAIGTLAGGIAHDFNNILAAISGYSELWLTDETCAENEARDYFKQILVGTDRAKDLVKQILTFSRQDEQELRPARINIIIKEALKLIRASIPKTIDIRSDIAAAPITIQADVIQIHQVLMNLCANAAYVMREKGGTLEINLYVKELESDAIPVQHKEIEPGQYAEMTVRDTGPGIDPEIIERIFDPFFTTKPKDEGSGLGLAVAHGIVRNHGGTITVFSETGKGTIFKVLLPVIPKDSDEGLKGEEASLIQFSGRRIMLVDDEEMIVYTLAKNLRNLGCHVITRKSSLEALKIFRAKPDTFDLVITDQTMPGLTGAALAKKILKIRPDIPIILCTGYSDLISESEAKKLGIREFLMKPVKLKQMIETLYNLFES